MAPFSHLRQDDCVTILRLLACMDMISAGMSCQTMYHAVKDFAVHVLKASGSVMLSKALPMQRLGVAHNLEMAPPAALTDTEALIVVKGSTYLISKFQVLSDFCLQDSNIKLLSTDSCSNVVALMQTDPRGQSLVPVTVSSTNVLRLHGSSSFCAPHYQISSLQNVKMIATGRNHALIVLVDGQVLSFGHTGSGALGHGDRQKRLRPSEITALRGVEVTHAAAGFDHSIFLDTNGDAWTCGQGRHGQLGSGSTDESLLPHHIRQLPSAQVVHCSAAVHTSCFLLRDGSAWTCGSGKTGILGHGSKRNELVPRRISALCPKMSGFVQCSFGMTHGLFLAFDCIASSCWGNAAASIRASVVGVGSNSNGQLGDIPEEEVLRPKELHLPFDSIPLAIAVSSNASLIVLKGGDFLVIAQRVIQACSMNSLQERSRVCQQTLCSTC